MGWVRIRGKSGSTFSGNLQEQLNALLKLISRVNIKLLKEGQITFTGLSYGQFDYYHPAERSDVRKIMLFGDAYMDAYDLTEKPKRLEAFVTLDQKVKKRLMDESGFLSLIHTYKKSPRFFWMLAPNIGQASFSKVEASCEKTLIIMNNKLRFDAWKKELKVFIDR